MPRRTLKFNHHQGLPETGFLRLQQVLAVYPIGKSSFYLGIKQGKYPPPVKLGPATSAWRVEDIRALIERAGRGEL